MFSCLLVLLGLGAFGWVWQTLQKSLPPLDGEQPLDGLAAPVQLQRDAAGVVTIQATTETDAMRALGFAHGQDRFFQMDLLRRNSAGELAALVGAKAVPLDRRNIIHRFREKAEQQIEATPADLRALVEAYAAGVNAGLNSLATKPWEYVALRTEPAPWRPADSLLVAYAMALSLQDSNGRYEWDLTVLRDTLGPRAVDFFAPLIGPDDSALDGSTAPLGEPPSPRAINLRIDSEIVAQSTKPDPSSADEFAAAGSNAFGVPGLHSASGSALLAGDPHLDLAVPNTWYRAALEWTDASSSPVRVEGLTLPGVPAVLIGSNGHLAWTFTNSYADTGDLVEIELDRTAPEIFYLRGSDLVEFEKHRDTITVKGGDPVVVDSTWTLWGPLVAQSTIGRTYAYKWTLDDPAALDLELVRLGGTKDFDAALAILQHAGMPPQNVLLASRDGRLTWTMAGRLPQRFGFDGRLPSKWTFGDRGWSGFLPASATPRRDAPPAKFLWSANQRMVGGEALTKIGDGGYMSSLRAGRIAERLTDDLQKNQPLHPADLLAVQLDTHASWLEPWREILRTTLENAPEMQQADWQAFRDAVMNSDLNATIDANGYRLLRTWVSAVTRRTLDPIFERCRQKSPGWSWQRFNVNPAVYSLHHDGRQMHLLAPEYSDWRALRLVAVQDVLDAIDDDGLSPATATWGKRNRARIRHPFSSLLPIALGPLLDLPADPLPGDQNVPRVQSPSFGASARMVVSPGHEDEGILHVPGGQSGHPLSPFYRAGHADWVAGNASAFQPGETTHTLNLQPVP